MNSPPRFLPSLHRGWLSLAALFLLSWAFCLSTAVARSDADEPGEARPAPIAPYQPAIELLPDSTAGLVRVPNLPKFCDAFERTQVGQLLDEPSMQPFIDAQRDRVKNYLNSVGKIGLRLDDLYDIATGEVVFAWLPFENDKRRPYSLCVVADTRGAKAKAEAAMAQIDKDLIDGGATRTDLKHRGQTVRLYSPDRKPGQLKVEQIAITLSDVRIIAADRDSVVTDLLDAIAGEPEDASISSVPDFTKVLSRSSQAIRGPLQNGGGAVAAEWFARPFLMGRILREAFKVDRGNEVDILKLLERQGFDALKAAGGVAVIDGKEFDFLHRSFILAPPTTNEPSKYEKAARMLQFVNTKRGPIPEWVDAATATFNRIHVKIEEAFWASESLIDDAMNDKIFREMIRGIAKDKAGPQLDIENEVLPYLEDEVILLTDNTVPVAQNSERLIVAIRVNNADAIRAAVRKVMLVEPDASKLEDVPGVEIWRVDPGKVDDSFDPEVFGDLDLGLGEDGEEQPPIIEHGAIALVDKAPGANPSPPYLVFSSHPDLLVATVKRIRNGGKGGYNGLAEVKQVEAALAALGCQSPAYDRISRTKLALRAKYELLRKGELRESDSLLVTLVRRIFAEEEGGEPDPLNAAKLPPIVQIERFFPNGGRYCNTVADGWEWTSFLLK